MRLVKKNITPQTIKALQRGYFYPNAVRALICIPAMPEKKPGFQAQLTAIALSMIALNAAPSRTARSARILRFNLMPLLFNAWMSTE